mmetsp:Transcript_18780/g.71066  ORF Transcript_18780/g.71066 Transcript_18780/m.71066 type:complete len:240 (+) Transcript_18780:485-1204(+)
MRVHRLPFDDEGDVAERLVVHQVAQVLRERRLRNAILRRCRELVLDEIVQAILPVISSKDIHGTAVHRRSMAKPLFRRSVPKRHLPICVRGPSIRFLGEDLSPAALLQVQLVEIVHRCSGAASEDIHAIVVDDRDVRVSWDWRLAVHDEATPQRLAEVEDVDVIEMPRAIVTTEQIQGVPINGASGPIAGSGHAACGGDLLPLVGEEVELVEVRAVASVVAAEDVEAVLVHRSGVAVPR